jgi:hypothetical protein
LVVVPLKEPPLEKPPFPEPLVVVPLEKPPFPEPLVVVPLEKLPFPKPLVVPVPLPAPKADPLGVAPLAEKLLDVVVLAVAPDPAVEATCDMGVPTVLWLGLGGGAHLVGSQLNSHSE